MLKYEFECFLLVKEQNYSATSPLITLGRFKLCNGSIYIVKAKKMRL